MDAPPRNPHSQHGRSGSQGQAPPRPGNFYTRYAEPSPPDTIGSGNYTYTADQFDEPPAKRPRLSGPDVVGAGRRALPRGALTHQFDRHAQAGNSGTAPAGPSPPAPSAKSKRVRTGCLTCRDRHLKCDEGLPVCENCLKSKRDCERGIRLNFIDVTVKAPPYLPRPPAEWSGTSSVPFMTPSFLRAYLW